MDWIAAPLPDLFYVFVSVAAVYATLIVLTRLSGVRSFSKMSGFDFAITVAIGSVIAGTVMAKTPPVAQGAAALAFLFALQMAVAALRVHAPGMMTLTDNKARLIMAGERIIDEQMRKAKITRSDLHAKLREANVLDYSQIEAVVAETTGEVSVLHRSGDSPKLARALLDGVIGAEEFDQKL